MKRTGRRRGTRKPRRRRALNGDDASVGGDGPIAVAVDAGETAPEAEAAAPTPAEGDSGADRPDEGVDEGRGEADGGGDQRDDGAPEADAVAGGTARSATIALALERPSVPGVAGRRPAENRVPELAAREFVISRLSHLSRRLEELHQAEVNRFSEERRETWILVFALSVVLVFCFAAFFMNQMEVRDLRTGLEEELERRSLETVTAIEETLDGLRLEKLPRMQASLEKLIREKDRRDRRSLDDLLAMLRARGEGENSLEPRLAALEARLEALLQATKELHLQKDARRAETLSDDDAKTEKSAKLTLVK